MSLVSVKVIGVGMDPTSNSPLVILKESGGRRALPIWIGAPEALAINLALDGVRLERPLTHDLIRSLLEGLQATVDRIVITELHDSTFFAQIMVRLQDKLLAVDARPSDSIAIALRTQAPIFVAEQVMHDQGFDQPEEGGADDLPERLKKLKPEDFGTFTL